MSLLATQKRDHAYKSTRQMRNSGWIPGIVFGHDIDSIPVQVKESVLRKFLSLHETVFEIQVGTKKHMASVGELQKDPVTGRYIHISLHRLVANEKVHMKIPIHWVGTSAGTKEGGVFTGLSDTLDITALPSKMPEYIEVDISNLKVGESIKVKDVVLGADSEWHEHDLEKVLGNCNFPKVQEVATPTVAETTEVVGETVETNTDDVKEAS